MFLYEIKRKETFIQNTEVYVVVQTKDMLSQRTFLHIYGRFCLVLEENI